MQLWKHNRRKTGVMKWSYYDDPEVDYFTTIPIPEVLKFK